MTGFRLRPEQQAVIDGYQGGYAAITAVPGAGKTTTLSALAATLIERIGPRQRVVIVTYQNAAVANFQRAVAQRLRERGLSERGFMVRTLHSLANEVLSSVRHRTELDIQARIIDEADAQRLLDDIISEASERQRESLTLLLRDPEASGSRRWPDGESRLLRDVSKKAIDELRLLTEDIETFQQRCAGYGRWLPFVLDVCASYQSALREQGYFDFDDIIARAVDVLERDPAYCERLRKRWPYLLEDEAQDSNPLLERMLRLIAGDEGNLVRVGDSNQSILTTFTTSNVEGFRRWLDDRDVVPFELAGSSRSTEVILDLANRYVARVQRDFPVEEARQNALRKQPINLVYDVDGNLQNPPVPRDASRGIQTRVFKHTDDERTEVVQRAKRYLDKFPGQTVAILVGSKETGYEYAEEARRVGFADDDITRLLGGRDGRQVGLIGKLIPLLDYLGQPDQTYMLYKALVAWSGIGSDDRVADAVNRLQFDGATTLSDVLYPCDRSPVGASLPLPDLLTTEEQQTFARLQAVPGWLENRLAQPHELLMLIGATIGVDESERRLFDAVSATVGGVVPDPGKSRLAHLREVLGELQRRQRKLRGTHDEHEINIKPGSLTISTRHQAKGLEWDVVFAVGCDDFWFRGSLDFQRWHVREYLGPFDPAQVMRAELESAARGRFEYPSDEHIQQLTSTQAAEEVSEGLRVMYVTITRARTALWLSWHRIGTYAGSTYPRTEALVFPLLAELVAKIHEGAQRVAAD